MKLTPEEIQFFQKISGTEVGDFLVAYMKKLQDHVYDSRGWKEGDSKDTAKRTAETLQELVIDKIRKKGDNNTVIDIYS